MLDEMVGPTWVSRKMVAARGKHGHCGPGYQMVMEQAQDVSQGKKRGKGRINIKPLILALLVTERPKNYDVRNSSFPVWDSICAGGNNSKQLEP
ncbi:hypothetical protein PoB_000642600 [Plakobranchus ocellatus]|uniref:Uncharacterized protein n=1 Tax=Plakobranchus ocellatus TaxID=259542 RepID=A0AAV3Y9L5_9GAST|nr:hypothetical protein PoB_000642600 [Plakobranchus ocellatus]